jgi:hypothetical protein
VDGSVCDEIRLAADAKWSVRILRILLLID